MTVMYLTGTTILASDKVCLAPGDQVCFEGFYDIDNNQYELFGSELNGFGGLSAPNTSLLTSFDSTPNVTPIDGPSLAIAAAVIGVNEFNVAYDVGLPPGRDFSGFGINDAIVSSGGNFYTGVDIPFSNVVPDSTPVSEPGLAGALVLGVAAAGVGRLMRNLRTQK